MRIAQRYICAVIFLTSLFWISINFFWRIWNNGTGLKVIDPGQSLILSLDKRRLDSLKPRELVTIDYFEKLYKPLVHTELSGPGMGGKGVKNLPEEKAREDQGIKDYGFNEVASAKISLERSVPENRDKRYGNYNGHHTVCTITFFKFEVVFLSSQRPLYRRLEVKKQLVIIKYCCIRSEEGSIVTIDSH